MKALIIDNEIQVICPADPPPGEKYPDGSRVVEIEVCPTCNGARYVEKKEPR